MRYGAIAAALLGGLIVTRILSGEFETGGRPMALGGRRVSGFFLKRRVGVEEFEQRVEGDGLA
jgi:hypothetical protein